MPKRGIHHNRNCEQENAYRKIKYAELIYHDRMYLPINNAMVHAPVVNITPTLNMIILNCPTKNGTTSEASNTSPAEISTSTMIRN